MTEHTIPDNAAPLGWRKSSYSGPEGGSCVEVLDGYLGGVPVRDSKSPQRPALVFSSDGWALFVAGVKGWDVRA
ncbi:DUF397 domain-containing protein [Streptomyces antibioticus]|uniref:DUF397 domain-containing protein n=1 Tax=Streptomyces antibioticus TaxID=1890 RepID=UPI0033B94C7F